MITTIHRTRIAAVIYTFFSLDLNGELLFNMSFRKVVDAFTTMVLTHDVAVPVAAMHALVLCINDSDASTWMELEGELRNAIVALKRCKHEDLGGRTSLSLGSGCELFMLHVTRAFNLQQSVDFSHCKRELITRGEKFTGMSLTSRSRIAETGSAFIGNDCTVLVHGNSRVVNALILKAAETKNFRVVVPEGLPGNGGRDMAKLFTAHGLPTRLILDCAVGAYLDQVDMVLVGAEAVMENGGVVNKTGTYQVAIVAKALNKPFYVAVESYKFARLNPLTQRDTCDLCTLQSEDRDEDHDDINRNSQLHNEVDAVGGMSLDYDVGSDDVETPEGPTHILRRTTEDIHMAVHEWCNNHTQAISKYGHISEWDVSRVTSFKSLFKNKILFNCDISRWDVSAATDMSYMFEHCHAFNQPLGEWNVSAVIDMSYMFHHAYQFNQPIGWWDVSAVKRMTGMFAHAKRFNQPIGGWGAPALGGWNVSEVTDMSHMFENCRQFNQPLSSWNVSMVKDMSQMFHHATSFSKNNAGDWALPLLDSSSSNIDKHSFTTGHRNDRSLHAPSAHSSESKLPRVTSLICAHESANLSEDSYPLTHTPIDFTPAEFITLLFTDLGVLTPAAVSDELIRLYQ